MLPNIIMSSKIKIKFKRLALNTLVLLIQHGLWKYIQNNITPKPLRVRELKCSPSNMCCMSGVTCHVSHVTCHMSLVTNLRDFFWCPERLHDFFVLRGCMIFLSREFTCFFFVPRGCMIFFVPKGYGIFFCLERLFDLLYQEGA